MMRCYACRREEPLIYIGGPDDAEAFCARCLRAVLREPEVADWWEGFWRGFWVGVSAGVFLMGLLVGWLVR